MQLANPGDPQLRPGSAEYAYVFQGGIHTAPMSGGPAVRAAQGAIPLLPPPASPTCRSPAAPAHGACAAAGLVIAN
ncbi:MAG: hypothetical protein FJW39_24215 [Acidobacteria bacterium]|nr:hypothetical protein [Acidobacteriota bacterium]